MCECVFVCLHARVRMVRAIHAYVRACMSVNVCACGDAVIYGYGYGYGYGL
ncbi:MAG: hypothetical protein GY820_22015 [Gammaproteobacteria bacterium]|nr:hypothetical protein [Gammaproteobacteria bacterium]